MVSSIVPGGTASLGVVNTEARLSPFGKPGAANKETANANAAPGDTVAIGKSAAWSAARESVRLGLEQVQIALDAGREAQGFLSKLESLSAAFSQDPAAAKEQLTTLIGGFAERVQGAIDAGSRLLSGASVSVLAEPGGAPLEIGGLNLTIGDDAPVEGGVFDFSKFSANGGDPAALIQSIDRSRAQLQAGLQRLGEAASALESHSGFLGAVAEFGGVNTDLNADSARLLALQVRQGLEGLGSGGIANAEPQAVLALFRT